MLTLPQLLALHRSLRERRVLSVFIDGTATDPALQRSWRLQLSHSLAELREWLVDSSRDERNDFENAVRQLEATLETFDAGGGPGWAAFITGDRIHDAQHLPVPVPTLTVWSTGVCLAPYMRALKETRPVIVAVADARRAKLYRYRIGKLEHLETIRAHHVVEPPSHMGAPPHSGFHAGTHGTTGKDAAQRSLLNGRDRMISDTTERIAALAGESGWILVGGIKRVIARLTEHLASVAPHRVLGLTSLDVHAPESAIVLAARDGASTLRDEFDSRRLNEIAELAGSDGLGALGPADTRWALDHSSVRELFLTSRYMEDHPVEAEDAVRAALEQGAMVEEVSGPPADQLDRHGGMAAGLRFRASPIEAKPEPASVS